MVPVLVKGATDHENKKVLGVKPGGCADKVRREGASHKLVTRQIKHCLCHKVPMVVKDTCTCEMDSGSETRTGTTAYM